MVIDGDNDATVNTRLLKGGAAPPLASKINNGISGLTGETRKSKAKDYSVEEAQKVTLQYVGVISNFTNKLKDCHITLGKKYGKIVHN